MTEGFEIVDAFVDGERVDGDALKRALAEPAGRDYLVDVLALREMVQATEPERAVRPRARRFRAPAYWAAAAALVLALAGGLFYTSRPSDAPPAPDRVVKLERGVDWQGQ
jgi:hypothetical protein